MDAEASRQDPVVSSLDSGVSMSLDSSLAGLPVNSPPTVQGPPSNTPGSQVSHKHILVIVSILFKKGIKLLGVMVMVL